MKKISLAILAIVYLTTTSGVMVHTHYCMGHLADWGFGHTTQAICNFCGMELHQEDSDGCCRDEFTLIQSTADQQVNEIGFAFPSNQVIDLPIFIASIPVMMATAPLDHGIVFHPPPWGPSGAETCILHQVFRL